MINWIKNQSGTNAKESSKVGKAGRKRMSVQLDISGLNLNKNSGNLNIENVIKTEHNQKNYGNNGIEIPEVLLEIMEK